MSKLTVTDDDGTEYIVDTEKGTCEPKESRSFLEFLISGAGFWDDFWDD